MEHDAEARRGFARMGFGCKHYRRRCRIRAPCCGDVFHCRHCHNESTKDGHELDRHAVQSVICLVCDTEQPVAQVCCNCGVCMGEYFCRTCKFFDDDVDKEHYHCKDCGICRVGGRENFFHCEKCGSCYSTTLREKHCCIENSMKNNCPICYEYLFDSLRETSVLRCGHTMHLQCFHEMLKHDKFSCPICSTSIFDMDKFLRALDAEVRRSLSKVLSMFHGPWARNDYGSKLLLHGKGMGRVLRLLGHDAGLLRRHGTQVLPLPVAQHLQGRSPRPPVASGSRQIIVLDSSVDLYLYESAAKIHTVSL